MPETIDRAMVNRWQTYNRLRDAADRVPIDQYVQMRASGALRPGRKRSAHPAKKLDEINADRLRKGLLPITKKNYEKYFRSDYEA